MNDSIKSATLPVETPPLAGTRGRLSYETSSSCSLGATFTDCLTEATLVPPDVIVMFSPDSMTCNEKPNGFLYVASVDLELVRGAKA